MPVNQVHKAPKAVKAMVRRIVETTSAQLEQGLAGTLMYVISGPSELDPDGETVLEVHPTTVEHMKEGLRQGKFEFPPEFHEALDAALETPGTVVALFHAEDQDEQWLMLLEQVHAPKFKAHRASEMPMHVMQGGNGYVH